MDIVFADEDMLERDFEIWDCGAARARVENAEEMRRG